MKGEHNKKQWEKLKALPNLIYTDGRDWALYRGGERPDGQPIVRLQDDPIEKGAVAASKNDAEALERLFRDFLTWNPIVPQIPAGLAKYLAPLTRFLRSEVESALGQPGSAVELLANEWRQFFFPDADAARFADAYAQTVTYAMLLARLSGASKLDPAEAAKTLDENNGLLARTLELLGQPEARKELSVGFELLQRSLEVLDPYDFMKTKPDLWLYFYEDFLAAYDPKLRKDYGVYYTPREVVEFQVRLASELLEKRFNKKLGFADDGVVFLDPAVGTGTYPVAAVKNGLEKVRLRSGAGAVRARARQMAENMHGFEILVGPYAVAHLRLTQALEGAINSAKSPSEPPEKLGTPLNIYLADTLESPNSAPPGGLDLTHKALTNEHEAARKVKNEGNIVVCLGNPPYDRQTIDEGDTTTHRKGGWVRFGDQVKGGAKLEDQGERPIFKDFTDPATIAGAGLHLKNLYNDYVYFWRWALWRLFEKQSCGGIITFITASSYLAGPGFLGMRQMMRQTFDELWIIDLGGSNLGARKTSNVFNIQTPVAIAIGVRAPEPSPDKPAKVHYAKIEAPTRENKLAQLEALAALGGIAWRDCPDDWHKPFLPIEQGDFAAWPALDRLFPLVLNGAQFKRHWPIGETVDVLKLRWKTLVTAKENDRKKLFRETKSWKITKIVKATKITKIIKTPLPGESEPSIYSTVISSKMPTPIPFSYRSFDRHFALYDFRLGDRLRPPLWRMRGESQVFFTSLMNNSLGFGQGLVACSAIPDLHHFRGSFGGKDVIPLYRDAAGTEPNVTVGLLDVLAGEYGTKPAAEDLAAYVYAVLGGQSYTRRFWNELETPGPRVPLTKDAKSFAAVAKLGRKLIWLHTYAERFRGDGQGEEVKQGNATTIKGVSSEKAHYPVEYNYNLATREITVGDGCFGPVAPEVWNFEVSGLAVVQSWLGYRMKKRAGKKSSPLDDIRPERWTPKMSDEFLELLWVLEATLAMEPELEGALDTVVASPCFTAAELPTPEPSERKPPGSEEEDGGLLDLMGTEDGEELDDEDQADEDPDD